ncbi:hypothetical protein GIB67_012554 [Kingdonia uniflora]|uniref:separase n=1 Tax=Kingdonia uniflora TaxID=39325 RepID=A0A7J7P7Y8_9MAGN|nr:hypothetical protein GIB67_012554 [Kingdonia uniflora]
MEGARTVEDVFSDFKGRRAGMIKALTKDVEEFTKQCDPGLGFFSCWFRLIYVKYSRFMLFVVITVWSEDTHQFTFDQVFKEESSQEDIYAEVKQLVQSSIDGYKVCIFAYGQTGSGKTYTMSGSESHKGVIPRALEQIFKCTQETASSGLKYRFAGPGPGPGPASRALSLSLISPNEKLFINAFSRAKIWEVYNDSYINLLGEDTADVNSLAEAFALLRRAEGKRSVGATLMNAKSSRGHFVFELTIHIVDEAINKSLSALGNVIRAIADKTGHVPFRASKLTHLLQGDLSSDSQNIDCPYNVSFKSLVYFMVAPTLCYQDQFVDVYARQDLEQLVTDFFEDLPSSTIVCITFLGGDYDVLLREILPSSSSSAWMLLSRLNVYHKPIVKILPMDLIIEDAAANSGLESIYKGSTSGTKWRCPWDYTMVDDLAPQFKTILEEICLSADVLPDSVENNYLWWKRRENLESRLNKFLSRIEETWLGPWKCMLLGEPVDCNHLDSVLLRLKSDINCKSEFDAKESLLRVFLGGTRSVSELRAFLNSYFVREIDELFGLSHQLILEAASSLNNNCIKREPLIMVFDSEVQMFPWENLPALRKQKQEVYRMPSFGSIFSAIKINCCLEEQIGRVFPSFPLIDPLDTFYLLNPSCDLEDAQKEFEEWFKDQNLKGIAGKVPKVEELASALKDHDLFIYIGHGNGMQYVPWYEIPKVEICVATVLMGCCSGSIYIDRFGRSMLNAMFEKRSTSSGNCTLCNSVVQEFELKNKRCNKRNGKKKVLGERKLKEDRLNLNCGHRQMIGSFISEARDACKLPFLNGEALVCYGVPTVLCQSLKK